MEQEPCLQIGEVSPPPPEAPVATFPREPSVSPALGAPVPVQPVTQKPQQLDQQPHPKRSPQPLARARPAVTVPPDWPAKDVFPRPQARARPRQLLHIVRVPTERPKRSLDSNAKIVLEFFCGKGELSRALRREGLIIVAFEILVGTEFGLSRRRTQLAALSLIRAGSVGLARSDL